MSAVPSIRAVQVDSETKKKPRVVSRLSDWQYLEKSLHRLICAVGREFPDWEDKVAISRHVWDQSECVRRIRERLLEFPGTVGNLEVPVSRLLEDVMNEILAAPTVQDRIDGIYQILTNAIAQTYRQYSISAHPVHDAPTLASISENMRVKEQLRLWLRDYRRRNPHKTDPDFAAKVSRRLELAGDFLEPLAVEEEALPAGLRIGFRPAARAAHPGGSQPKVDIMPVLEKRFVHEVEIRRLFWCYGYLLEMNLAENQLIWLWDAHSMPWDFIQDVSRHMWDESRHGDSGHSRLLDFGISLQEIGYPYYEPEWKDVGDTQAEGGQAPVMSEKDLYEAVFFIGMVAETGHFTVKHEAYADFKEGGDMESAEMMLFDIIDETSHVQYAHKWLPLLAERAGTPDADFKAAGAKKRQELLEETSARADSPEPLDPADPAVQKVEQLLAKIRSAVPLTNSATCPPRSYKPM